MIDMRKQLHLELPDYDNPVIYLPQIDYLVNATFHIHALCDTKENLIKTGKLELEGKRIQDTEFAQKIHIHTQNATLS